MGGKGKDDYHVLGVGILRRILQKLLHVFLILRAPLCYHVFSYPPAVSYGFFLGLQTLRLGWAPLCSCVIQT